MKKRAHIPHNCEMSFEIHQGNFNKNSMHAEVAYNRLKKQAKLSQKTDDFEIQEMAVCEMLIC